MTSLISAELLKLRRRRWVIASALLVTIGLELALYAWGGDGGEKTLRNVGYALAYVGSIAGILLGCMAGAGDDGAGVLRELVATGRSRWALFAARIPALLAIVVPLSVAAGAISGVLATLLAGNDPAPSLGLVAQEAVWDTAAITFAALLTLGVASVVGNQAITVAALVGGHLMVGAMLVDVGALGSIRHWIPLGALGHLEPSPDRLFPAMGFGTAVAVLLAWVLTWLAGGAWRTVAREL